MISRSHVHDSDQIKNGEYEQWFLYGPARIRYPAKWLWPGGWSSAAIWEYVHIPTTDPGTDFQIFLYLSAKLVPPGEDSS